MSEPEQLDPDAPTEAIIAFALAHPPTDAWEDPHWEAIRALRGRATREVFDATARLIDAPCAVARTLGVDVHAQLGAPDHPFATESAQILLQLLSTETNTTVISAAILAFAHLGSPERVSVGLRFADHTAPDVRNAAASALAGQDDHRAINALIGLTQDSTVETRDWATFYLGTLTEWDSPELRAALWARLGDTDNITRGEALKGLALRRDERAADAIIAELLGLDPHENAVEAAEELADPRLVPALEALGTRWSGNPWLERVIEICRASGLCAEPSPIRRVRRANPPTRGGACPRRGSLRSRAKVRGRRS